MASFINNSGDIILDVVISDEGRRRLARGDGSFKIVKFGCVDTPINYGLYNKNHASGSAYYDLEILQTPIFEAFTDNGIDDTHLITIPRSNLLYLPVIKLNQKDPATTMHTQGAFFVAVDQDTEDAILAAQTAGIMTGETPTDSNTHIQVDQGLDTTEISPKFQLDPDLIETQYILEMDNRLGQIVSTTDGKTAAVSFIDDDNIATYFLTLGTDKNYVSVNTNNEVAQSQTIAGPRGTILNFKIKASVDLNSSSFLFTNLGSTTSVNSTSCYYIDSYVKIVAGSTGSTLLVPVRFLKKI